MKVMIAKANQDIILGFNPKVKFEEASKNTCIFKISEKKFAEMIQKATEAGYNRFALFYW